VNKGEWIFSTKGWHKMEYKAVVISEAEYLEGLKK